MLIKSFQISNYRSIVNKSYDFNTTYNKLNCDELESKDFLQAFKVAISAYFNSIPNESFKISRDDFNYTKPKIVTKALFNNYNDVLIWTRSFPNKKIDIKHISDIAQKKYDKMYAGSDDLDLPIIAFFSNKEKYNRKKEIQTRLNRRIFAEGYKSWYNVKESIYGFDRWLKTYDVLTRDGKEYKESLDVFFETLKIFFPFLNKIEYKDKYIENTKEFFPNQLFVSIKSNEYQCSDVPLNLIDDKYSNAISLIAEITYRCIVLNGNKKEQAVKNTKGIVFIEDFSSITELMSNVNILDIINKTFPNIQFFTFE